MKGGEKILAIIIAILLIVVILLGIRLDGINDSIGVKELELNKEHQGRINTYQSNIEILENRISTLQSENENLKRVKSKVRVQTINQIDSVIALPFDGKAGFFTERISYLDTISRGYLDRSN